METNLLQKYGGAVPRYTSYPTAPHFNEDVTADVYRIWLNAVGRDDAPLSLYCHLPFCDSLCWFCGCHTKITHRYEPVAAYLSALLGEAALVAGHLGRRQKVSHLHWGGGSPTLIAPEDFLDVTETLKRHFDFTDNAEIAIEIDPRDLTQERIAAYAASGINRASIGVQDFAPRVQAAINRNQSYEVTARAVDGLREANINRLNFDLMYGLPYQTVDGIVSSVDQAVALSPDRIALFGYAHVPWMKKHQRLIPEEALPSAEVRYAQQEAATERLAEKGYRPIGLDHFARPDDPLSIAADADELNRNFQGYTTDDAVALIGLGASAIGSLPQGYVQNDPDIRAYQTAASEGRLATRRGVPLSSEDRQRRAIITDLMCRFEVDLEPYSETFQDQARPSFDDFIADEMVEICDRTLRITERGKPFVRSVCARFDTYLARDKARHSAAV